jgi:hypothetical protein
MINWGKRCPLEEESNKQMKKTRNKENNSKDSYNQKKHGTNFVKRR